MVLPGFQGGNKQDLLVCRHALRFLPLPGHSVNLRRQADGLHPGVGFHPVLFPVFRQVCTVMLRRGNNAVRLRQAEHIAPVVCQDLIIAELRIKDRNRVMEHSRYADPVVMQPGDRAFQHPVPRGFNHQQPPRSRRKPLQDIAHLRPVLRGIRPVTDLLRVRSVKAGQGFRFLFCRQHKLSDAVIPQHKNRVHPFLQVPGQFPRYPHDAAVGGIPAGVCNVHKQDISSADGFLYFIHHLLCPVFPGEFPAVLFTELPEPFIVKRLDTAQFPDYFFRHFSHIPAQEIGIHDHFRMRADIQRECLGSQELHLAQGQVKALPQARDDSHVRQLHQLFHGLIIHKTGAQVIPPDILRHGLQALFVRQYQDPVINIFVCQRPRQLHRRRAVFIVSVFPPARLEKDPHPGFLQCPDFLHHMVVLQVQLFIGPQPSGNMVHAVEHAGGRNFSFRVRLALGFLQETAHGNNLVRPAQGFLPQLPQPLLVFQSRTAHSLCRNCPVVMRNHASALFPQERNAQVKRPARHQGGIRPVFLVKPFIPVFPEIVQRILIPQAVIRRVRNPDKAVGAFADRSRIHPVAHHDDLMAVFPPLVSQHQQAPVHTEAEQEPFIANQYPHEHSPSDSFRMITILFPFPARTVSTFFISA